MHSNSFERKSNASAVVIHEDFENIGEPAYLEDDVDLKSVIGRPPTPTVIIFHFRKKYFILNHFWLQFSLDSLIETAISKFVDRVKNMTIEEPEEMQKRELIHLHHFQKRLILRHLKQYKIYLKLKVEQDWNKFVTEGKLQKIGGL